MKISAAQAYCILDTVGSSILTKSGEISVSYLLELPEAYSLDRSDLEERHNELFRAFQYVRTGFIHKQDVFLRRKFKPEYVIEGEGYIQTAERKYFDGREYLHHFCILSFTLSGLQSLEKAYQANPLAYSEKLAKADRDRLAEFLESVESAVSIIRNIRGTQIRPLNVAEVKQHLFRYVNGFHDDEGLRDIQCSDMIRIGQKKGIFFAVCDERYLPDRMKVYVTDSTLQEANSQLYMSMLERIGVHVPCSHVVNQIWKFAGADRFHFELPGDGMDVISDFAAGTDHLSFDAGNFGGLNTLSSVSQSFDTDALTTLQALANQTDASVYRVGFAAGSFQFGTGSSGQLDELEAAITGGNHTGSAFFLISNGDVTRLYYDADTSAGTDGSGLVALVELANQPQAETLPTDVIAAHPV